MSEARRHAELDEVLARERSYHDELAARLDPHAMPPTPADEWEEALLAAAGDVEGRDVLELGCGEGDLSLKLLARGARLTGLDLSPGMAAVAAARAERFVPGAAARFLAAPAERTGLGDASFDVAIGKFVLHHLDLAPAAAELARLLRPGGRGCSWRPRASTRRWPGRAAISSAASASSVTAPRTSSRSPGRTCAV